MSTGTNGTGAADRVSRLVGNAKHLAQQDVAYVKQQAKATARHGGIAAGGGIAAAMLSLYLLAFLGLAGGAALIELTTLPAWAAWLIVAGVFLLVILILLLVARSQGKKASTASQLAGQQVKDDVEWAKVQVQQLKEQVTP